MHAQMYVIVVNIYLALFLHIFKLLCIYQGLFKYRSLAAFSAFEK